MSSPTFGGKCGRCGKWYEDYQPTTMCMACAIEREMNRAKVWRCPVKRKAQGVKRCPVKRKAQGVKR